MPSMTGRMAHFFSITLKPLSDRSTRRHVERYRSSDGRKGSTLMGKPVFLLDVVGRTSGEPRPVMLMLVRRGDDLLVCGSNAGNSKTPNWYLNLMAAGGADVQVGAERWTTTARELPEGAERDECWTLLTDAYPDFASYQEFTERRLPVAVLERVP
jgi:deazaflavin-dependent oxidoreductase (nitroreductase family)